MPVDLSSSYYAALKRTQRHHQAKQGKTFSGRFTWKQRHRIKGLIDRFEATSMLDYGCGWGKQYQERDENKGQSLADFWGVDPVKFDPGVPHFQAEPKGKFDLVISVQVLGSIPTADLPAIVDRLYAHTHKAIFVAERIGGVRKPIFEDMEAAMPHGKSMQWWLDVLTRPGSPVRMVAAFHNADEETGWPGWRVEEPEGQG
jgi:hypothetical protein